MHTVVRLSQEEDPSALMRLRIEKKVELWTFFKETVTELLSTYDEAAERTKEITSVCIHYLHPEYEGPELLTETRLVLQSLRLPIPEDFAGVFAEAFQRIVFSKIKSSQKD